MAARATMQLATFSRGDGPDRIGAVLPGERVLDLTAAVPGEPAFGSMVALIEGGERVLERAAREIERVEADGSEPANVLGLADVRLRAPIPRPRRNVFCVGMNYHSHVEDNARALGVRPDVGDVPLFI
jgi:2-keto-4-pentenoate hydratase/2-oxohepta-3-ene-1,7-dioic acid hydratase in catechol pathway